MHFSDRTVVLTIPIEKEDLERSLVFRCEVQLTQCNDSSNQLCRARRILGPLTVMQISGMFTLNEHMQHNFIVSRSIT